MLEEKEKANYKRYVKKNKMDYEKIFRNFKRNALEKFKGVTFSIHYENCGKTIQTEVKGLGLAKILSEFNAFETKIGTSYSANKTEDDRERKDKNITITFHNQQPKYSGKLKYLQIIYQNPLKKDLTKIS